MMARSAHDHEGEIGGGEKQRINNAATTEAHRAETATSNILQISKHGDEYLEYFSTSVPVKTISSRSSEVLTFDSYFSNLFRAQLKMATRSP